MQVAGTQLLSALKKGEGREVIGRRLVRLLTLAAGAVTLVLGAFADETAVVGGVTWTYRIVENGDAWILKVANPTAVLTVPAAIDGHDVTRINGYLVQYDSAVREIRLPTTVRELFYQNTNNPFTRGKALTAITVDADNPAYASVDGVLYSKDLTVVYAVPGAKTSVELPKGLKKIGPQAFQGCVLNAVTIPDGVTFIGKAAFGHCRNITELAVPNGVTEIQRGTFSWCESLTKISLPQGVTSIGNEAFYCCRALETIDLPKSVASIGDRAFGWCTSLRQIRIPAAACAHLGSELFLNCSSGLHVTYEGEVPPSGGDQPGSDEPISQKVEYGRFVITGDEWCPHVVYDQNKAVDFAVDAYGAEGWRVTLHFPRGSGYVENAKMGDVVNNNCFGGDKYEVTGDGDVFRFMFRWWCKVSDSATIYHYGWVTLGTDEGKLVILGSGVCEAENLAVVGCNEGTSRPIDWRTKDHGTWVELTGAPDDLGGDVVIPALIGGKPVRRIGEGAFAGCRNMTGVFIPASVESVGDGAFASCLSLKRLELPGSVTNVGMTVIQECRALDDLHVGGGLPTFGYKAFAHSGVTNVVIESGVTNIDNYAFADSRRLVHVEIPDSVERICTWSFDENCESLKAVTVPAAAIVEEAAFPPGCVVTRRLAKTDPTLPEGGQVFSPEVEAVFAGDEKGLAAYKALFAETGELNADGSNAVARAQGEVTKMVLGKILASTVTGEDAAKLVIDAPIKGFYYVLVQQVSLPGCDVKIDQKLAGRDDMVFGLTKWPSSGYYRMIVSPEPVCE